ncbi:MAG: hypothetical protein JO138_06555 [Acidobacteriaceae bacterium]|nr:hypothetical protein [Acidobacteriaceae bacterium]
MHTISVKYALLAALTVACGFGQATATIQTFPLQDTNGLIPTRNVKAEAVEYQGRRAVRLAYEGHEDGFAVLPGTDFQDGVIEAEIALKVTTPPGVRNPGFLGIAFRARPDASHYELFYLRPGNAVAQDQAMRNHAVQYVAAPDFGWYQLRRAWPWVYESHADLKPETWTKVKIEVAGRMAKLYVNGSDSPALVVDGLKGEDLRGVVALWGYANEEAYFSNVRITPAAPLNIKNGSDITGTWNLRYSSDAGVLEGSLKLNRDATKVSGTWSGALGQNCAVTGTWRDGYIELSFPGEWPKDVGLGVPGPVTACLAGWIDGNAGKGRMRVEAHSDGQWTATRKE